MGALKRTKSLGSSRILIVVLFGLGNYGEAAITVDPNNTGANDVVSDPSGTATPIGNPLPDPWKLGVDLAIGKSAEGELLIDLGSDVVGGGNSYLGYDSDSLGTATINGTGASWNNTAGLFVGYFGEGLLNVLDGATLGSLNGTIGRFASSTGSVNVDGIGSNWSNTGGLTIGEIGNGNLSITGGAATQSNTGRIAVWPNSTSTVVVSGLSSQWSTGSLSVGIEGKGTIQISDGGVLTSTEAYFGTDSAGNGAIQVEGNGSNWNNTGDIFLGMTNFTSSSGSLEVFNGGSASNVSASIGHGRLANSRVLVEGSGSNWTNSNSLVVGQAGQGTLSIEGGGRVTSASGVIGFEADSVGLVEIQGNDSNWNNTGNLTVGGSGAGTLQITESGIVIVDGAMGIGTSGLINMATNGMLALPGDADDSLNQFLDLMTGTDSIQYWDVSLLDWVPITSGTTGVDYTLEYNSTGELAGYTLLTVLTQVMPGDFTQDAQVDGRDFLAWQRNPGVGNLADWQANYGTFITSTTTGIPEPSAVILVSCCVGLITCLRC